MGYHDQLAVSLMRAQERQDRSRRTPGGKLAQAKGHAEVAWQQEVGNHLDMAADLADVIGDYRSNPLWHAFMAGKVEAYERRLAVIVEVYKVPSALIRPASESRYVPPTS